VAGGWGVQLNGTAVRKFKQAERIRKGDLLIKKVNRQRREVNTCAVKQGGWVRRAKRSLEAGPNDPNKGRRAVGCLSIGEGRKKETKTKLGTESRFGGTKTRGGGYQTGKV